MLEISTSASVTVAAPSSFKAVPSIVANLAFPVMVNASTSSILKVRLVNSALPVTVTVLAKSPVSVFEVWAVDKEVILSLFSNTKFIALEAPV